MALSILDGNQTATTLSTVVSAGAHIPAHTVVSLGSQAITDMRSAVSGSVVSISNFPSTQTIAGTVTANNLPLVNENFSSTTLGAVRSALYIKDSVGGDGFVAIGNDYDEGLPVRTNGTPLAVEINPIGVIPQISGTVTANVASTTVTVSALPSGALTTRFGSVTTANLSQLTSCVTNTSRKYLLAQNISAGTVTIGIGFSPTTTQGIQLPAGGGLTFDAFCPTGAVYWLGAVTGAAFTILEG